MKELIEKKYGVNEFMSTSSSQEYTQTVCWMLHWLLIYSFTAEDLTNTGLFATILSDHGLYGNLFLNVVQLRSESLTRYMIASFLLANGQPNDKYKISKNALEDIACPIAVETLATTSSTDAFSGFLQALYQDYDLDKALGLVETMAKQAEGDFLLKNYVFDIKKQAYLLVFQTKCKIFRSVEISEIQKHLGSSTPILSACEDIERHLQDDGFDTEIPATAKDGKGALSCFVKKQNDTEHVLNKRAHDLF